MITLDTLRADHLGCYGYFRNTSPNLDALAKESLLFEHAYTPMATTFPSHLSLFTGFYPQEHGFLSNTRLIEDRFEPTPAVRTVAQRLKEIGYRTAAFVSAAPVRDTTGLSVGFDSYDQPTEEDWRETGQRRASDTAAAVERWLNGPDREAVKSKPIFLWVHFFDPHWPYNPPPPFDKRFGTDEALRKWIETRRAQMRFPDKWKSLDAADVTNLYDGEIGYLDDELGRLFARFKKAGLWDRAIIIVASDHGEGLGQHEWAAHGQIFEEELRVALMVRMPGGVAAKRVKGFISLTDVFPTVFGLVGPPLKGLMGAEISGEDFFSREAAPWVYSQRTDHPEVWEAGQKYSIRTDRWRFYYLPEAEDRLFDLAADPFELKDVKDRRPDVAATLKKELIFELERQKARATVLGTPSRKSETAGSPAMEKQLEGLGYVESEAEGADKPKRPSEPPPTKDPGR